MSADTAMVRQLAALLGFSQEDEDDKTMQLSSRGLDGESSNVQEFLEAAAAGERHRCQSFVRNGGNPNARGNGGLTAMHTAAHKGQLKVLKALLQLGANIDATDKDGDTPLILAVFGRKEDAVDLLIKKGANVRHVNNKGVTAADIALMKFSITIVTTLEGTAPCLQFNHEAHEMTLAEAAQKGNAQVIDFWLKNNPDRQACNRKLAMGRTMAFIAALNGHLDIVQLLESNKADLELTDENNHTPMFCAAQNDHFEVVQFLLEKGCNVNHVSGTGRTPIFSAVNNGHDDIVKMLIEKKADVSHADEEGTTPLECAIRRGFMPIFQMLLGAGANPKHVDKKGYDLPMYAADTQRLEMLKELKRLGAPMDSVNKRNGETALLGACQVGPKEVVEFLLKEGGNVNHRNRRGVSPILRAVYNELADVVEVLINAGADVNMADNDNDTPILVAAQQNNMELVKLLHSRQGNLAAKNVHGVTMAWFAAKSGNLELAMFLKDAGAPMDMPDSNGNTPLMIATKEASSPEVVSFLVHCGCSRRKHNQKGEKAEDIATKSNCDAILEALRTMREPGSRAGKSMRSIANELNWSQKSQPPDESTTGQLDASFTKWEFMLEEDGTKKALGRGAFGAVFRAITDKEQFVAVKVVKLQGKCAEKARAAIAREKRGVEAMRGIRHSNIIEFLKCETNQSGDFYIFTELIAGLNLVQFMNRQKKAISEDGILKFSRQICSSLNFLHHRRPAILHRDIKCSNIMLTYQGVIKLIDFGLAKEVVISTGGGSSDQCGTLAFMAPELFEDSSDGRVKYTGKSDVWAFGCTVYEMAMMKPPNSDIQQPLLIGAIIKKPPPSLPKNFSSKLRKFHESCVTKAVDQRPDIDELMRHEFLANK